MAYSRPTLKELEKRVKADYNSRLGRVANPLRQAIEEALVGVDVGVAHLFYDRLLFLADQLFATTAEGEYLDAHFAWRTVYRQQATFAEGQVVFTGNKGQSIPTGAHLKNLDNSVIYRLDESVTIDTGGTAIGRVIAQSAGEIGNLTEGTELILTTNYIGIAKTVVTGEGGITGGSEAESDEDYRARVIATSRTGEVRTGKPGDYEYWAISATPEITKAFERPLWDENNSLMILCLNGNSQVSEGGLATARELIETESSVGPFFLVATPDLKENDFTIEISPNSTEAQQAGQEALEVYYNRVVPGETIELGTIAAVVGAVPEINSVIIKSPGSDITHTKIEYPILGEIRWTG